MQITRGFKSDKEATGPWFINMLRIDLTRAQLRMVHAMDALAKHAKLAAFETRGRTYVTAGLLVLPLVWSLAESWQSSYWSLLISLDVWVLGLCVFWYVREAFLPPVTIEELYALRRPSSEPTSKDASGRVPAERAPEIRGWYDNASDAVNFVVPAFVALAFLAIEIIVLKVTAK
jgi:hypothetical protein